MRIRFVAPSLRRRSRPSLGLTVILGLVAFLPVSGPALGGERVTVELGWERGGVTPRVPRLALLDGSPETELPAGWSGASIARLPLPDEVEVAVLVDDTPDAERLLVDTDLDGRFEGEEPVVWTRDGLRWTATTGVQLPARRGRRIPLELRLERHAFQPPERLEWSVAVHRWGAAAFADELHAVALEDVDGDLVFDPETDLVLVDVDGDGSFDFRPGSRERLAAGDVFEVAGGLHRLVELVPSGSRATFERLWGVGSRDRVLELPPAPVAGTRPRPDPAGFALLVQRLDEARERSPAAVAQALTRLGTLADERASRLLLRLAHEDPSRHVRAAAASALGNPAHLRTAGDALLALVDDPPPIGPAAMSALHAMDHPERHTALTEVLGDRDPDLVEAAARHTAYVGNRDARLALLRAFRASSDPHRERVLLGARHLPDGPPDSMLLDAAEEGSPSLRALALTDLWSLRHHRADEACRRAVLDGPPDPVIARAALPCLSVRSDAESVAALVRIARVERLRPQVEVLLQTTARGATAIHLWPALESDDPRDRRLAAEVLGVVGHAASAERLRSLVADDPESAVLDAALTACARIGDERVLGTLGDLLVSTSSTHRGRAVGALARPHVRQVERARELVRRMFRATLWKTRVAALEIVGAWQDPRTAELVLEQLDDPHHAVRTAAAQALAEIRPRAAVSPLIDLLGDESSAKVRAAAARALFRTTGLNLYDDHELWSRWWDEHGTTFVVPARAPELPPADAGDTRAAKIPRFYGLPIESDAVVFVMDRSSSMEQADAILGRGRHEGRASRFRRARDELLQAVGDMPDGARVNVLLFDDGVHLWRRGLVRLASGSRRALADFLDRQRPSGATNLFDALESGLAMDGVEALVLLSDGEPNRGEVTGAGEIITRVAELNRDLGIIVHGVSIGRDSGLLRRLARDHEGSYVRR